MRQRRSLFEIIFGRPKPASPEQKLLQLLNGSSAVFSSYTGQIYDYDIVRSAIDAVARNAAKLQPQHIRQVGADVVRMASGVDRLLSTQPNPYMDTYSFLYRTVTHYLVKNNAFVWPDYDDVTGELQALYPVLSSSAELLEGPDKKIYVRFRFMFGEQLTVPYVDLIHLRRFYYEHDLMGESNDRTLKSTLELVKTTDEGIVNAIKSSAVIRGILKFTTAMLKPEDMKKQRDDFVKDYLDISNNGGVAATDSKADYVPIESKPQMVDAKQMAAIKEKVYDYFGVNEKIVKSTYNEDEWNAFYESTLEPLAIQMSMQFSNKLFTQRERGHGNRIIFEPNRLQYASMRTKLSLVSMVDRGAMTPNEWRAVLNLGPIEGGDKPVRRLDTAEVDSQAGNVNEDEGSDENVSEEDLDAGSEEEGQGDA